ncbi:hypothetical protein A3F02_04020 [Candidatus Curtissbacteria bacterium RIFCSPHIGHO2_12_FULL_38_9b]|uniref:Uncharacterized protein n=2 Tax=Candidatus Curtissiibacteriota TaxID=1752717 RepID=A0A1F5GVB8_9BACT|nr:MAG: hypothetical protein A3A48_02470 [Candidatus Curtissbacteria bacterium RIFCSPLOWO2_01_FULL_37_9]OGD95798.1 MAG: hypothetical protein A3F02_04020 [Candidatus Curtissbacteria bacterium RIFCSPHIGHO2_12_FULL_38_9b]
MKKVDIAKYLIVAYTFTTLPLAGIGLLGYVLYMNKKFKEMEAQVKAAVAENEEKAILTKNLDNVVIKGNVDNFDIHEECVIENYQNRFYRIMKPSGEYLNKIFLTLEDAKKEIDVVAPLLVKPERKRSRIYNIRYVK